MGGNNHSITLAFNGESNQSLNEIAQRQECAEHRCCNRRRGVGRKCRGDNHRDEDEEGEKALANEVNDSPWSGKEGNEVEEIAEEEEEGDDERERQREINPSTGATVTKSKVRPNTNEGANGQNYLQMKKNEGNLTTNEEGISRIGKERKKLL